MPYWRMPSLQMSRKSRWWQVMQPLSSEHRTQPVQFSSRPALAAGTNGGEGLRRGCGTRARHGRGTAEGPSPVAAPLQPVGVTAPSRFPANASPPLSTPQTPLSLQAVSVGTRKAVAPRCAQLGHHRLHHAKVQD